jgi:transcription initiation factor TFIID subunit 7
MHYARKRRFPKRISRTAIEAVEDAMEKLLEADAQAISTRWEMFNPDVGVNDVGRGEYSEYEDAEEEVEDRSYFGNIHCTGTMNECLSWSRPCYLFSSLDDSTE